MKDIRIQLYVGMNDYTVNVYGNCAACAAAVLSAVAVTVDGSNT